MGKGKRPELSLKKRLKREQSWQTIEENPTFSSSVGAAYATGRGREGNHSYKKRPEPRKGLMGTLIDLLPEVGSRRAEKGRNSQKRNGTKQSKILSRGKCGGVKRFCKGENRLHRWRSAPQRGHYKPKNTLPLNKKLNPGPTRNISSHLLLRNARLIKMPVLSKKKRDTANTKKKILEGGYLNKDSPQAKPKKAPSEKKGKKPLLYFNLQGECKPARNCEFAPSMSPTGNKENAGKTKRFKVRETEK